MRSARVSLLGAVAVAASLCAFAQASPGASARAQQISVRILPRPKVRPGTPAVIPIRVENASSGRATGVTLDVRAPSWVKLSGRRCIFRPARLRCALPDLAAGTGVTLRISAKSSRGATYRIVAVATGDVVPVAGKSLRSLAAAQGFRSVVAPISASLARRMTGVSWRAGCPVALADLRAVSASHWGFDGRPHTGTIVVHRTVAAQVARVLGRLYAARFPIRRMVPVDAYGGDDFRSIEADNTSAFNCRPVAGTSRWSEHAYGRAIDLDPLENPYVSGGRTSHAASRRYLDRSLRLPGMVHPGDTVVRAFAAEGWGWGGTWSGDRDYQHFSPSSR